MSERPAAASWKPKRGRGRRHAVEAAAKREPVQRELAQSAQEGLGKRGVTPARERLNDFAAGALLPAVVLAVWQGAGSAGLISPYFLPTPLAIAQSLLGLTLSGELIRHLGVSMGRAGLGFLLGGALGLLFGIVNGLFRKAEYLLDPSFQALRLVPHLAIAPLIILWLGFGESSKIAIITVGAFFPLYINTFLGIRQVDHKLLEVGKVLGFGTLDRLRRLVLPAALPNILLGLRLSLGVAWIGLVVAELIGSQSGVGFLINEAKQNSDTTVVFVGIIIFAAAGKLVDSFVRLLERKLLFWRDTYTG